MSDGLPRLGIDFGTSNTVAVLAGPDGRVRPLVFDGSQLLASAVFAAPDGTLLVGADALRAAVGRPAGLEPNPKRRIDDGSLLLGDVEVPVVDAIAAVLERVRREADRAAGESVRDVVLTHPATWGRHRLAVLAEAAERAGLASAQFVPEPVAAGAYFAAMAQAPVRKPVVVYDLGAGTFDVSVVRNAPDGVEVVAADGLADVGGLDLDAVVVRHARECTADAGEAWRRLDAPQTPAEHQARQTLWQSARAVKEHLSRHASGDLLVPLVERQVHLTRDEFERIAQAYLERTAALTATVLASAGVAGEDVAGVFLVGGSSRIPLAATLLHRTLRVAPTIIDHPEFVVAEGALDGRVAPAVVPMSSTTAAASVPPAAPPPPRSSRRRLVLGAVAVVLVVAAAILAIKLVPSGTPKAGPSVSPQTSPSASGPAPQRMLAVIDVSGSMLAPVEGVNATRMQVTASAVRTSLLQEGWSVGLWSFSTLLDGQKDYRELAPIGPVSTQRPQLEQALAGMVPKSNGSDGLHATLVAAYRSVQAGWQVGAVNTLLLVADGPDNSDNGGSVDDCIAELRAAVDAKKPIRVVLVGLALEHVGESEFRRITDSVGGTTVNAPDVNGLADVLRQTFT